MAASTSARFLNMSPEAVKRRRSRESIRAQRKKPAHAEPERSRSRSGSRRIGSPCCGLMLCNCKGPAGLRKSEMKKLVDHFKTSPNLTAADTTDVEPLMRLTCGSVDVQSVPLSVLFGLSFLHALFNQEKVWEQFIEHGAITYKEPWEPNFDKMQSILSKLRKTKQKTRSSNYYSVTLKNYSTDGGYTWLDPPTNKAHRDVLMAKLVWISVPRSCWDLYEETPSRHYWTAIHVSFQEALKQRSKGICHHYMHKCALDRLFSVRRIDPATVAWWPTQCAAYLHAYQTMWADLTKENQFAALMLIYKHLRRVRHCSIPEALAHTCWLRKDRSP